MGALFIPVPFELRNGASARIYLSAFRASTHVPRCARSRGRAHPHERTTIFVIVRADRDKDGARGIAIKPTRAFRLVYFLSAIPSCIARISGNPLRLILALGAGGSLIRYNPTSRIGILAERNLHVCPITKATSPLLASPLLSLV